MRKAVAFFVSGCSAACLGVGCESKSVTDVQPSSANSELSQPAAEMAQPAAESSRSATQIAQQLREAMTTRELMQLEAGASADSGLQGIRQREVAKPLMNQLVSTGTAAAEPLRKLLNDSDASVRRSAVLMLVSSRTGSDGKPVEPTVVNDLLIPLLEESLKSDDEQVRRFACEGLGNFASWSKDCFPRLAQSLPALKALEQDTDPQVQAMASAAIAQIDAAIQE